MAIKLIHHVNVQISDRDRTRAWYEKVLGAEFLDRGPALNRRQLQLRLGSGEIHFTVTPRPIVAASSHFAIEVDDWEGTMAHLDQLGIEHVRTSAASTGSDIGGTHPQMGRREDSSEHYAYIKDPDGNLIELVNHPLGLKDSQGRMIDLPHDPNGMRWVQIPGFVEAEKARES
jgi:catechol 2,3-dioxygenase-like lactoylglutathione lyase family enzyme